MQHAIDPHALGPQGPAMTEAVERCVHCGFCLAACPTYRLSGAEAESPRGRIVLMKEVLEGGLDAAEAQPYLESCLGCQACEPACPSGVAYGALLHPYRDRTATEGRSWTARGLRWLVHRTLPFPWRFRGALAVAGVLAPVAKLLPAALRPMLTLAPSPGRKQPGRPARPWPKPEKVPRGPEMPSTADTFAAMGSRRARVALLRGCAQQVLAPEIENATVALLSAHGVEVVVPRDQGCCGALALHEGAWPLARRLARRNLKSFHGQALGGHVDAVISNAAGCGSGMRELGHLFAGETDEAAANDLASGVMDVSVFLDRLGLRPVRLRAVDRSHDAGTTASGSPFRLAYQDACHLAQAQGIKGAPRRLLEALPGVELVPLVDEDLCCGSAGTYNLFQPEQAQALADRKVDALLASGAQGVASGNIGCLVQLRSALARRGVDLPVCHTVEWLAEGLTGSAAR